MTALKSSNKVVPLAHIWDFKMARHRLTLSISPELKHALDELNDATGVAAASFVGEIIEGNCKKNFRNVTEKHRPTEVRTLPIG